MGTRTSLRSNRISSLLLYAAVAAAPLPFGSTDLTTLAFWCVVLGIGLVIASPRALCRFHFAILGGIAIVIASYALVLHEQLSGDPWLAAPHPIWIEAAEALGTSIEPSVSVARNQPFFALGAPLVASLSLTLSLVVCADRSRARQLLFVIGWSGAFYAALGITMFLIDPTMVLWREKQAYQTVLTGTFINRNTAAVYFGSCAAVWLVLLCEAMRQNVPPGKIGWLAMARRAISKPTPKMDLSFSMLFIVLAAMFMTSSRAGVLLSLGGLVIAFAGYFYRDLPRWRGALTTLAFGGIIGLVLIQILGPGVRGRLDADGLTDWGRFETYRSTLRMIADHPWFGTGLGTFAWSYPAYRSADISVWGVWDRAHNTLLELAVELGLPLTGLVFVGWMAIVVLLVRGVRIRQRGVAVPAAALAIALLALLHSLVDFSLQISGFAIVVFAIVGAGLSQSTRRGKTADVAAHDYAS